VTAHRQLRATTPVGRINHGSQGDSKGPDREADRGRRPGQSQSSRWSRAGKQRCEEHGLLQGKFHLSLASIGLHDVLIPDPGLQQEFNARTAHINPGVPIPARVTVRPDRSFTFELRTPATSWLLLQAANVPERKGRKRGAMNPGHEIIGTVSLKHVYEIAKIKQSEMRLSGLSLQGLCKCVIAQAKSMGIQVVP